MKDALIDERLITHISKTKKLIEAQGYALQSIQAQPSFTYTIGLSQSHFGADVLIPGTTATSISWLHRFSRLALEGAIDGSIEGRLFSDQFGGVPVQLRRLLPRQVEKLMRLANVVAGPSQVRGFVLIVPVADIEQHDPILREEFLHSPVLDERNLR